MAPFYGKYRGEVTNNIDPLNLARVQVAVPAVLGASRNAWAMPCAPFAGPKVGFLAIPPVGAHVWVEFEGGDPDYPIWSGGFWTTGQLPLNPAGDFALVCAIDGATLTLGGMQAGDGLSVKIAPPVSTVPQSLTIDAKGISLQHGTTVSVKLSDSGIELKNGENVTLQLAPTALTVEVNQIRLVIDANGQKVQIELGPTSLALSVDAIELKQGAAAVKVSGEGIKLTQSPGELAVSAQGVNLQAGMAKAGLTAASVELSNGASSVKLTPAMVNINNGALEVM